MTIWHQPQKIAYLTENQIHIWRAKLDLPTAQLASLNQMLSADEQERANRYRYPLLRQRFVAARGILRQLLGHYLNLSPQNLEFSYSKRGKPRLKDVPLQFNISHSQGYALYGFARQYLIGVDLEQTREMPDAVKIAQRFFTPQEFEQMLKVDLAAQQELFFQYWTAKEAYLKAVGSGLAGSLAQVEIAFDIHGLPYIATIAGQDPNPWQLYSCCPSQNYVGAIAVNSFLTEQQICFWHWPEPDS